MVNEKIIIAVKEIIEEYLTSKNIQFFLGGSRRFGYHIEGESDVDLFILNDDNSLNIKEILYSSVLWKNEIDLNYPGTEQFELSNMIHINFITTEDEYNSLYSKHIVIKKYINQHQNVIDFVRSCKLHNIKGKEIFNIISTVAHKY